MLHVWSALKLLTTQPKLWLPCSLPLFGAVTLFLVSFFAGLQFVTGRFAELSEMLRIPAAIGSVTGGVLLTVLWILLSGPIFLVFFGVIAIPTWEVLSRRVERHFANVEATSYLTVWQISLDIFLRIVTAVFAMVIVLVLGFLGLSIVGTFILGFLILIDCSAPSLMRRGHSMFQHWGAVFRSPGWFSLWIAISLSSMVPILNVLLLPVFVIASTLMVLESESSSAISPASPVE